MLQRVHYFKITAKFRASGRLRFEDTKRIMSPEIRPKSFGTFEKRAPDPSMMLTTEAELLQYRSKFSYHCRAPQESRSARPRKTFTEFRLSCNLKWSFNSFKRNNFHYLQLSKLSVFSPPSYHDVKTYAQTTTFL